MELKDLKERKSQLEQQLKQLEQQIHQVLGAVAILDELINKENEPNTSTTDNKKKITHYDK